MQALGLMDNQQQQEDQPITTAQENVGQSSGAGQSAGAPQQQQQSAQPQASAGARGRVMARNVQKAQAPTNLGKITSDIGSAKQSIQNEANAYLQAADDPYEQSREQVRSQVQNYAQGAPQQDLSWLTQYRSAPGLVQDLEFKTDTGVSEDIPLLETDAGIRELFRRGQSAEGTIGEAALDAALLRRNQGFQQQRGEALKAYQELQKQKSDIQSTARSDAQAKRNEAADAWKRMITDEASGMTSQLEDLARQREAEFDSSIGGAADASRQRAAQDAQAYADELAGNYSDPLMQQAIRSSFGQGTLDQNIIDPYQFYTPGNLSADQTSYQDFYGEPEAQQFEKLMGLLGGGETRTAGRYAGKTAADVYGGSLDKDRLREAILGRAGAYSDATKTESDRLEEQAQARLTSQARKAEEPSEFSKLSDEQKQGSLVDKPYEQMTDEEKKYYDEVFTPKGRHKRDPYWMRKLGKIAKGVF